MKIGFIGLGRMGHHVAANLLKAGHQVTVWNRSEPRAGAGGKGAVAAKSPEDAVKGDAVFSMLSNDQVMREVGLAGPLLEKAAKGLIHVNLATISVEFAKELAAAHRQGRPCLHFRAGVRPARDGGSGGAGAGGGRRRGAH